MSPLPAAPPANPGIGEPRVHDVAGRHRVGGKRRDGRAARGAVKGSAAPGLLLATYWRAAVIVYEIVHGSAEYSPPELVS
jgi:hypothetical protein